MPSQDSSLNGLIQAFLESIAYERRYSPVTVTHYRRDLRKLSLAFAQHGIDEIRSADVRQQMAQWRSKGCRQKALLARSRPGGRFLTGPHSGLPYRQILPKAFVRRNQASGYQRRSRPTGQWSLCHLSSRGTPFLSPEIAPCWS